MFMHVHACVYELMCVHACAYIIWSLKIPFSSRMEKKKTSIIGLVHLFIKLIDHFSVC